MFISACFTYFFAFAIAFYRPNHLKLVLKTHKYAMIRRDRIILLLLLLLLVVVNLAIVILVVLHYSFDLSHHLFE